MKGEGEIPSKLRGIPDFAWTSKEKKIIKNSTGI